MLEDVDQDERWNGASVVSVEFLASFNYIITDDVYL